MALDYGREPELPERTPHLKPSGPQRIKILHLLAEMTMALTLFMSSQQISYVLYKLNSSKILLFSDSLKMVLIPPSFALLLYLPRSMSPLVFALSEAGPAAKQYVLECCWGCTQGQD